MATYTLLVRPKGPEMPGFRARVDDRNRWTILDPGELELLSTRPTNRADKVAWWTQWLRTRTKLTPDSRHWPDWAGPFAGAVINSYPGTTVIESTLDRLPKERPGPAS